jgi:hypothetical protein
MPVNRGFKSSMAQPYPGYASIEIARDTPLLRGLIFTLFGRCAGVKNPVKSKANNKKHSHSWVATRLNASEISINNWLIGDSRCKVSSSPLKLFFVRSEETGTDLIIARRLVLELNKSVPVSSSVF